MHSSIFNSKRIIPERPVSRNLIFVLIITAVTLGAWEIFARSVGYSPAINDDADLWVEHRAKLQNNNNATVIIGSSRILFGFELDTYEKAFNEKPIQLSTIGINPSIYLENLAEDPNYRGTVFVGYAPGLFFASGGAPVQTPIDNIHRYNSITLAQKISFYMGTVLDQSLAFLQPDDLKLSKLIDRLDIPNRVNTNLPPELPPYFYSVERNRQGGLGDRVENDKEFAAYIENIWLGLMAPHESGLSIEEKKIKEKEDIKKIIDKVVTSVNLLKKKGGQVIFFRYPSTRLVRKLESQLTPRNLYWDRLIKETNSPGIHFEDYVFLKNFKCPEGGHISKADRKIYTNLLVPLIRNIYDNREGHKFASNS